MAAKKSKIKPTRTEKAREVKPENKKAPREDRSAWGVFAFRLPLPEREAFHTAAGPAGASRTLRALADAFTKEDRAAFESIVEEAKKLRA
jgi:hypothetical protein